MANVELPQIGINNTQIDEAGMDGLKQYVKSLLNVTVMLTEELTYLLNNLDTRNVNELNADIINAGTINANLVKIMSELSNGGYISFDGEGMKVNDGTRDTMTIGHDGKPKMSGAYIESAAGYPKLVMDPEGNLFGAYLSERNFIQLVPVSVDLGSPQFKLVSPTGELSVYQQGTVSDIYGYNSEIRITAQRDIVIMPTSISHDVIMPFDQVLDFNTNRTLYAQLLGKASSGVSTGYSGGHNHGIPDGTQLMTAEGGTVTFFSAPQHSHSQN